MKNLMLEKKKIIKNTLLAMGIAAVLLVVAVLPAEYGIDPIGAGKVLGFSRLYIPKTVVAENEMLVKVRKNKVLKLENLGSEISIERPKEIDNAAPRKQTAERSDEIIIDVPAKKGIEYKVIMKKYDQFKYEWITDEGTLFHDFHGEVKQGDSYSHFFESYTQAFSNNMVGTFLAPFEGIHGWYFSNKSDKAIKVTLKLSGQYTLKNI
jgi:hypothetical protein